jgi:hypothetical protein
MVHQPVVGQAEQVRQVPLLDQLLYMQAAVVVALQTATVPVALPVQVAGA